MASRKTTPASGGSAKNQKNLVTTNTGALPADMSKMFEGDSGGGFEDADRSSYAIPFLRQLQILSPQLKRNDEAYIDGAEEGDFFNTVTEKVYPGEKGILFIPCYFHRVFNLWAPNRGGFRGSVDVIEGEAKLRTTTRNDKNQDVLPDGNIIQDTREHYGMILEDDGTVTPVLFAMASSQLKHSKKWMTRMQEVKLPNGKPAPMFAQVYRLISITESKDNDTWAGVKPTFEGFVTSLELYNAAKLFRDQIRSGEIKVSESIDPEGENSDGVPF